MEYYINQAVVKREKEISELRLCAWLAERNASNTMLFIMFYIDITYIKYFLKFYKLIMAKIKMKGFLFPYF